jgi:hypothetical protein
MSTHPDASPRYLQNAIKGIGHAFLLFCLEMCVRFFLAFVESDSKSRPSLYHRFLHRYPGPVEFSRTGRYQDPDGLNTTEQSRSNHGSVNTLSLKAME